MDDRPVAERDEMPDRELDRPREPDRHRDVFGSWSSPAVLRAPVQERRDGRAAPDEQGSNALRRADLVPGDRQVVDGKRPEVDGDLA